MQPLSAHPAYLRPTLLCSRTPFTPALACYCFLSAFGIIWDYDYMRHWKKKAEMGKTKGLGRVHINSPGRCPSRILNGH